MQPLTSDAHEAVGEDGQVNGVKLCTHHAGHLGPHRDADVPSLSHLCLAAWLHQDGTGGKGAEGLEEPGQAPPQPGTPHAQAKEHPNREGTPESSRLPQLGPENRPPTTTARAPQFTMGLTPHTPTLARPQPTCCCQ